ncbi:MAG: 4Fe-4S binding protein [Desulfovibrionales bacterium]
MTVFREIGKGLSGLWSLLAGMSITGKYFFHKQVTVHYPRQVLTNLDTFRGHIELIPRDEDPSIPRCIACGACSRICPTNCIYLDCMVEPTEEQMKERRRVIDVAGQPVVAKLAKTPPPKQLKCRTVGKFQLDYTQCSLCGNCVRICPVQSLRFSNDIYLASYTREPFNTMDLLQRMHEQVQKGAFKELPQQAETIPAETQGPVVPVVKEEKDRSEAVKS